jgi:hypothetical protein
LVDHNVLSTHVTAFYGLVDEFLRVRFLLDQAESPARERELEKEILFLQGSGTDEDESAVFEE